MKDISLFGLLVVLLFSCGKSAENNFTRGSLQLSFDDTSVCNWEKYLPLLDQYDVKATFYICRPQTLTPRQWLALHRIANAGHEIACHGLHHANPFSTSLSTEKYVESELLTCRKMLMDSGFQVKTVGFPFGNAPERMEELALKHFKTVRRVIWDKEHKLLSQYDELFSHEPNTIQTAMGIDSICAISLISIESACKRAHDNHEKFYLIAHEINTRKPYSISKNFLIQVLEMKKKYRI